MRPIAAVSIHALAAGALLLSGCVIAPDHDRDRGYDRHETVNRYDRDRDHDRHLAYERCREEGGRDCDDILHR